MLKDRWNEDEARSLDEPGLLAYRSNLLGADLAITNFGGGNTSAKVESTDPLTGEPVMVLWVKGSGGDLGSIGLDGFSTLYQDKLLALEGRYRGLAHEDEMVDYLPHCTFDANPRAASIDTPLHAYLPFVHIDHMHPDSVIAIAAAKSGEALTEEIYGGELGWLPWQRPGFDLGLQLRDLASRRPGIRGVVLGGHGVFTWAETSHACYAQTISVIRRADAWLDERAKTVVAFGGEVQAARSEPERRAIACQLMPRLRGLLSKEHRKIGHFNDDPAVLTFVGGRAFEQLAALGTSCPDHFLRTKIRPLVLPADPDAALAGLEDAFETYRLDYEAYYARCKRPTSPPLRDPYPVVLLMPGVGMFTFAKSKATARIAGEFYVNAIHVMRGASAADEYVGLPEQECFDIEYWLLEEAKLARQPAPKPFAGRTAIVTGGAGGIGSATARRLLEDDACVFLLDIDEQALKATREVLVGEFDGDRVATAVCDVTQEESVVAAFRAATLAFGGIDIVVSNAGIASAARIEDTSLELWRRNLDVLATGYFLVAREGTKVLKAQGTGGSMVFIASKNALAASAQASAYNAAKAAEVHLARTLALELAPDKIRVNVVNPDAVLRGSTIWTGSWKSERAAAYGIAEDELEAHYRERSLLKESVYPEDVAEAVHFLASDRASKTTGNMLNVDAGVAAAFTR